MHLKYDAIVIGSGQGGNPLAVKIADRGAKVALIESGLFGGTCVNTGCTPTKTMVASAQVAYYARNAARWGVRTGEVSVDLPAILKRKNEVVERSRSGWPKKFANKVDVYHERARFAGMRQVQAGEHTLEGERIFINTGALATIPPIEGLSGVPYLTNVTLLELQELPEHLLVLGGGYVAVEFGQMFRRFGSRVTIVQNGARILPHEDEDVTTELQKCLEAEGIQFVLNGQTSKVDAAGKQIRLTVNGQELSGSHLLVAVGRSPQSKDLDLEKTGVKVSEKGYIAVNERLETSAPGIWAIGDVNGGPAFTHISYNDYQIVYGNVYEGKNLSTRAREVPYGVFTDPTLGRVGITEKEARAQGRPLKIGKVPMTWVARALERAETSGFMKILVDATNDRILGAAILASEGAELVQVLGALMLADQPYTLLKGAVYIHPTLVEGFFALMDSVKPAN